MKLLAVAVVALFAGIAGTVLYGRVSGPEDIPQRAYLAVNGSRNLTLCERIVAETDAGSNETAEATFGRLASEGIENCRTLMGIHNLK